jgi:hypothetical protein
MNMKKYILGAIITLLVVTTTTASAASAITMNGTSWNISGAQLKSNELIIPVVSGKVSSGTLSINTIPKHQYYVDFEYKIIASTVPPSDHSFNYNLKFQSADGGEGYYRNGESLSDDVIVNTVKSRKGGMMFFAEKKSSRFSVDFTVDALSPESWLIPRGGAGTFVIFNVVVTDMTQGRANEAEVFKKTTYANYIKKYTSDPCWQFNKDAKSNTFNERYVECINSVSSGVDQFGVLRPYVVKKDKGGKECLVSGVPPKGKTGPDSLCLVEDVSYSIAITNDVKGQLTRVDYSNGASESYVYDAMGNRLFAAQTSAGLAGTTAAAQAYVYVPYGKTITAKSPKAEIEKLERALVYVYGTQAAPTVKVDGVYDTKTTTAIKMMQQKFGLKADGVAGVKTQQVLKNETTRISQTL